MRCKATLKNAIFIPKQIKCVAHEYILFDFNHNEMRSRGIQHSYYKHMKKQTGMSGDLKQVAEHYIWDSNVL